MCIFCKINNGEIKSKKLYESDYFFALLDQNPLVKGHCLLISKRHYQTIFEMTEKERQQMGKDIQILSKRLEKEFGSNILIVNTSGEEASQSVPHFHIHLIPRKKGDRLWDGEKSKIVLDQSSGFERMKPEEQELDNLYLKLIGERMKEEKEYLKFAMVGHIDHGKSTLIGRLFYDTNSLPEDKIEEIKKTCEALGKEVEFGFIMDHLEEEREQGITIDTAQTFFRTDRREYVIIDAPGHVEFIKNMITGASQAEAAILIVDAEEGVKEQTKRHSYVLSLLGLDQITVVINKMDLVNYQEERFNEVKTELLEFLSHLNIKPNYVIPISAKLGDNVAKKSENMLWYGGVTVLESLDSFVPRKSLMDRPLRMPVQDVYKIEDKRINVGRVESGTIKEGDLILILPERKSTKVKSVEKYLAAISEAKAGESTGIVTEDALFLDRGMVICHDDNLPMVTDTITANVFWMAKQPFDLSKPITMKIATQEVKCYIKKMTGKINSSTLERINDDLGVLKELEVGTMLIKTEKPVVIDNFNLVPGLGRFVFEQDQNTCAGGIIIGLEK